MRRALVGLLFASTPLVLAAGAGSAWTVNTQPVAANPQRVRLAPLDGDEFPDLALTVGDVALLAPQIVGTWRNIGGGRFQRFWAAPGTSAVGDNGVPLEVADVNEDGLNDLVLANMNTDGFTYRLGDGSATFPVQQFGPSFGGYVDAISVVDYDGDGHLDVGTTTLDFGWYVDRFKGDGAGGFNTNLAFNTFLGAVGPMELASGDVDGDGLPEDFVAKPSGLIQVTPGPGDLLVLNEATARVVVADLTGDGLCDLAASVPFEDHVQVLVSLGGGVFASPVATGTGRRPTGLTPADLDLDGDLDLAVCDSVSGTLSLLHNEGGGAFVLHEKVKVGKGPDDVTAGDIDLDGDADLVVANAGDDSVSVLLNPLR